jgi:hypothetical protein
VMRKRLQTRAHGSRRHTLCVAVPEVQTGLSAAVVFIQCRARSASLETPPTAGHIRSTWTESWPPCGLRAARLGPLVPAGVTRFLDSPKLNKRGARFGEMGCNPTTVGVTFV